MKYKLHMAYANRADLAAEAYDSVVDAIGAAHIHVWPNGINGDTLKTPRIRNTSQVHRLPPMAPVSIINLLIHESWHDDVMFWMHNDALALPGVAERILAKVEELHNSGKKWGALFTHYDVLCAFNMAAVRDIGYWDPMFFQYTADPEFYHRMRKGGWSIEEFGPGVLHRVGEPRVGVDDGSVTVRSDPLFNLRTQWRESTGFDKDYYRLKWGGLPGAEKYDRPFGPQGDSLRRS